MNSKNFFLMVVVLAVLAGIAVWQRKDSTSRHEKTPAESTLLAGADLNAIDRIEVSDSSGAATVVKKDGRWAVESLYDYPADFSRLAGALRAAAEVKTGAPVRTKNVDAAEFGLNAGAKKIVLKTGDQTAAEIIVGARREASSTAGWANQYFITKSGGDSVFLVDYDFRPFAGNSAEWMNKELLRVQSGDVVAVKTGDVELKEESGTWTLAGLDLEKEKLQTSEANRMRSAMQYLNCTTVADPAAEFSVDSEYTAKTKDGFTYTVKTGTEADGGRLMQLAVEYVAPPAPAKPSGDDADQAAAFDRAESEYHLTVEANTHKAAELNARLSGWTYVVSTYSADAFRLTRDKLVKEKEPAAAENLAE
ncbi:MAG: DUF4340 domain-containing protein [Kiritimatiellales bacterium]